MFFFEKDSLPTKRREGAAFTKPLFISVFSMLPLSMSEHVFLGQFFVVPHFDAL